MVIHKKKKLIKNESKIRAQYTFLIRKEYEFKMLNIKQ